MPPRKKSKAKKSAKTPVVVESTTIIDNSSTDLTRKEDESVIKIVEEHDEEANVMKEEVEAPNGNSDIPVESLRCDGENRVPASSGVEVLMKEEVVEERSIEIVMEENVNFEDPAAIENDNDKDQDANMDTLELIEGGAVSNGGSEPGTGPVAEPNLHEEELAAESDEAEVRGGDHNNNLDLLEDSNQKEASDDDDDEEDSEDDNKDPIIEENNVEIFVGGLDKKVVEDDLSEVFGKFGEIKAARIVRKTNTNKSKGFAFIQYATLEQTKYALSELKEGIEVKGKHVRISTSQDKDALYVGNICGTWTKEQVLEKLKEYGIEDIVDIQLADHQNKNKEFVVLKLSSHTNAVEAHKRLSMPDAVFGCDRSAKVAFKHHVFPNDELLQVKRVYIEWPTGDWNEEKLKEICKEYGEISEVKLIKGLGKKRKDFGFVSFTSRENALACVQGINNTLVGEDKVKVKAAIAKPQKNGRTQHHIFSGGFLVEGKRKMNLKKEDEKGKIKEFSKQAKVNSNPKWEKRKGKAVVVVEENKKFNNNNKNINNNNKPRHVIEIQTGGREKSKIGNGDRKRKNQTFKGEGYNSKGRMDNDYHNRPPKRARENPRGRQNNNNFRNPKGDDHRVRTNYQGHISASKRQSSDMEPHAGFLQPVGAKQVYPYPGYGNPHSGYLEQRGHHPYHAGIQSQSQSQPYGEYREAPPPHVIYHHHQREPETTVWTQHSGYRHPQPHPAGYHSQPAPADGRHVSSGSAYVAGSPLPPYVAKYSSYPGYEGPSAGGYYQSNGGGGGGGGGGYVPRRGYY